MFGDRYPNDGIKWTAYLKALFDGLKQQSLTNTPRAICIINWDVVIWLSSPGASTVHIVLHFQQNQVRRSQSVSGCGSPHPPLGGKSNSLLWVELTNVPFLIAEMLAIRLFRRSTPTSMSLKNWAKKWPVSPLEQPFSNGLSKNSLHSQPHYTRNWSFPSPQEWESLRSFKSEAFDHSLH